MLHVDVIKKGLIDICLAFVSILDRQLHFLVLVVQLRE